MLQQQLVAFFRYPYLAEECIRFRIFVEIADVVGDYFLVCWSKPEEYIESHEKHKNQLIQLDELKDFIEIQINNIKTGNICKISTIQLAE